MRRRVSPAVLIRGAISILLCVAVLAICLYAIRSVSESNAGRGRELLETSIRRACTACYAVEGCYPQDIAYLQEHYGLQVDEERYVVFYSIFAENLMPDITVLERP